MKAIHSTWTKPGRYGGGAFGVDDFDLLTTILSALKWREKNGEISMITDSHGLEYYKSRGMCGVWDSIKTTLDDIPDTINPEMFWAAGKLFALGVQQTPIAAMDTDFIVWDRIAFDNLPGLTVIHDEELAPQIYPDSFKLKNGGSLKIADKSKAYNAAFYVIKDETFRNEYVKTAIEFMENAADGDRLTYMVYAEQRLMAVAAKRLGTEVKLLSDLPRLFADGERYFTHTWGMKQQLRENTGLRYDFCKRCIDRICSDFPDYKPMLTEVPELAEYF